MGFFDIFKRKKEPAMPEALAKVFKLYFPNGIEQQKSLTEELRKKLGSRYSYEVVANNYVFVLTCLFKDEDKTSEAIINRVQNRPNNKLSESDILIIYNHAISNNEQLSEAFSLLTLMERKCENGTSEDMMPEGYGEFGLEITNPIPIHGIPENEIYLKKLRLNDGSKISWKRIGSCSPKNIDSIVDNYLIFDSKGDEVCNLYLCPYNLRTSHKTPKGFIFEGQSIQTAINGIEELKGKLLPYKKISYATDENGEPMMVYYRQSSKLFVNKPTDKDVFGYFLNIRHPLLIDVTGKDRIDMPIIPTECDGIILKGYGIHHSTAFFVKDIDSQTMKVPLADTSSHLQENNNFDSSKEAYLLLFSASWCGPSKRFKKEIEAAGITFYSYIDVDDDENQDLASKYEIRNIPTTLLIATNGEIIKKWVGYDDEDPGQTKFISYIKNCPYKIIQY